MPLSRYSGAWPEYRDVVCRISPRNPPCQHAESATDPTLPGPTEIQVPGVGTVRLDAAQLLPDEQVSQEAYTYSFDEDEPIIVALVHSRAPAEGRQLAGTGSTELGVVAVSVEGPLEPGDVTVIRRTVGVDAARGTHVWRLEGGYPEFGVGEALLFQSPARDACAERVETYHVGSGRILSVADYSGSLAEAGSECRRTSGPE